MDSSRHISFNASDRSYLAILKKDIRAIISTTDFDPQKQAHIDLIIAEMASNLVKHANGGEILVRIFNEGHNEVVEIISIDNGPGINDLSKMMEDGISTTNTLGHGLGSIKRLSDVFNIYSLKDWGTIVLSRVYKNELPLYRKKPKSEVRSVIVAKPGEIVSGDSVWVKAKSDYLSVFIGDGLGHGFEAAKAVNEAIEAFKICPDTSPVEITRFIHKLVKRTRGLVGTIAIYDFNQKKWLINGVGNISSRIYTATAIKSLIPYNGIIGMNIPTTMKDQEIAHDHGQVLIMCSDGIKTRWDTFKYPAIFKHDLSIFAAAVYKDFARKTDDMSVVVCKIN